MKLPILFNPMNFPSKKTFVVISLSFIIQWLAFRFMDPLGYPDTIRYFNLADFLSCPSSEKLGDLAYYKGLLFTPLFLPVFLIFFKNIIGIPYIASGELLHFISFQAILWLSFWIAYRIDGKKAAWLTLILILTNLSFIFNSVLILTEYPFTAVLLCVIFYLLKKDKIDSRRALILSLFFALLVSIRTQGFIFLAVIASYLLYSKAIRLKQFFLILLIPLSYFLFYFFIYGHLDATYPLTFALNEGFSLGSFIKGDFTFGYSFLVHGLKGLSAGESFFNLIIYEPTTYIKIFINRLWELIVFIISQRQYYYFFTMVFLISLVYAKVKKRAFLVSVLISNLILTILFLTPYYAFIRYQMPIFSLCLIFVSSYFVHAYEEKGLKINRKSFKPAIFFTALIIYLAYFISCHYILLASAGRGRFNNAVFSKKAAINSSRNIYNTIGDRQKILASNPLQYGMIYRSGNRPLYFYYGWEREEILDYLRIQNVHYLICDRIIFDGLKKKDIRVRYLQPLLNNKDQENQLFLCAINIKF